MFVLCAEVWESASVGRNHTPSHVSLVDLVRSHALPLPPDLTVDLAQWLHLANHHLQLPSDAASAAFHLTAALAVPAALAAAETRDDRTSNHLGAAPSARLPLGSLLLLLWVQAASSALAPSAATLAAREQAIKSDTWRTHDSASASHEPLSIASAVQARRERMHHVPDWKERRRVVRSSLSELLILVSSGSPCLYAHELDRLCIIIRPDERTAARLAASGLEPCSLSDALGLWEGVDDFASPLPVETLLRAFETAFALDEMDAPTSSAATSLRVPLASVGVSFADLWPDEDVHDDGAGEDAAAAAVAAAPEAAHHGWIERMPPTCVGDAAMVRVSAMRRRTLVLQGDAHAATSVHIVDCHQCFIYVLSPLASLDIIGCSESTFFASGASRVLSILHCEKVSLHAAAQLLCVADCIDATLHLCVQRPPLLWASMDASQHSEVAGTLQARFRDWLVRTGHIVQVTDLLASASTDRQ